MPNRISLPSSANALFKPFAVGHLSLPNRIVMAPMTRAFSPSGIPGLDVAAYYRRRTEGGVGLIITEGILIPHPAAGFSARVPQICGDEAVAGWRRVVRGVHAAGGKIISQLWHVGAYLQPYEVVPANVKPVGPSGLGRDGKLITGPMQQDDIEAVVKAYGVAAETAQSIGFDGLEIHAAHGYLIDQFFWNETNKRTDRYGGDLVARTRFATEVLSEVRSRVGPNFPIFFRYSQWKQQDYSAKLARSPEELALFLEPLVAAGVDVFHCSVRRFWEPEFAGSELNLAGWTKKLTDKPVITVGSVTLSTDFQGTTVPISDADPTRLDELAARVGRGEFDLVAVGRALIANPDWATVVSRGELEALAPYSRELLKELR